MEFLGSSGSFWTPKPEPPAQPFAGSKEPDIVQVPCAIHDSQIPALHQLQEMDLWSENEWTELRAALRC